LRLGDRAESRRVVQRRQRAERFQPRGDLVVDQRRFAELGSAVDNAVCNSRDVTRDGLERLEPFGRAVGRDE
jgi:hypothetical protein